MDGEVGKLQPNGTGAALALATEVPVIPAVMPMAAVRGVGT